jgi:hypothetical protein
MTPTPRTDKHMRGGSYSFDVDFARQLERDITTLNDRLIDRQKTLMEQAVKLQNAERLLTRCRDSAGRMEMGLYEDIQNYLHGEQ